MDDTKKRPKLTPEDLAARMPMLVSEEQLTKIIEPLLLKVRESLIDIMPIIPKGLDEDHLVAAIAHAVEASVVVENKTVENTTIQQMELPAEVVKLLSLQTTAISLLKSRAITPAININDYKPHDQFTVKGTKLSFYGFADQTGRWYIMRQNGRDSTQRYAAGIEDYASAWENRDNHKYGLLSEAMND